MELQEIATKLGVHRGTLFHWLSGNRSPSKESMLKIELELGWSVDDQMVAYNTLTGGKNPRGGPADAYGTKFREFLELNHDVAPTDPRRRVRAGRRS
jgi:transcriptional regulator with XRE-family HTH domain